MKNSANFANKYKKEKRKIGATILTKYATGINKTHKSINTQPIFF